jgi:hypothetical protein
MILRLSTFAKRVKFAPTASSLSAASALSSTSPSAGTAAAAASRPRRGSSFARHPRRCPAGIVISSAPVVAVAVAPANQPRRRPQQRRRQQQQQRQQRGQQVRFHRTDYDGPGRYDERETGANFGGATTAHDPTHAPHGGEEDEDLTRMRRLLRERYDLRSGSYERRGYTVGIGGPGGSIFVFSCILFSLPVDRDGISSVQPAAIPRRARAPRSMTARQSAPARPRLPWPCAGRSATSCRWGWSRTTSSPRRTASS